MAASPARARGQRAAARGAKARGKKTLCARARADDHAGGTGTPAFAEGACTPAFAEGEIGPSLSADGDAARARERAGDASRTGRRMGLRVRMNAAWARARASASNSPSSSSSSARPPPQRRVAIGAAERLNEMSKLSTAIRNCFVFLCGFLRRLLRPPPLLDIAAAGRGTAAGAAHRAAPARPTACRVRFAGRDRGGPRRTPPSPPFAPSLFSRARPARGTAQSPLAVSPKEVGAGFQ